MSKLLLLFLLISCCPKERDTFKCLHSKVKEVGQCNWQGYCGILTESEEYDFMRVPVKGMKISKCNRDGWFSD